MLLWLLILMFLLEYCFEETVLLRVQLLEAAGVRVGALWLPDLSSLPLKPEVQQWKVAALSLVVEALFLRALALSVEAKQLLPRLTALSLFLTELLLRVLDRRVLDAG